MAMKLTKRTVEALLPNEVVWDGELRGFGARRQRSAISYVLRYRVNGAQRQATIGRHGPWTPDTARKRALELLGQVVRGTDPLIRPAETFGGEAERFLGRRQAEMKPRAFEEISRHLRAHAKPLANQHLSEINRRAIAELLAEIETGSGPVARNRVRSSLSAFWNWCIREELCEINPVQGTGNAYVMAHSMT
jgi:hypothetical protein